MEVDCVNRKLYQRLDKVHRVGTPNIWVSQELLKQTQTAAENIDNYARDPMWNVLIPLGERARYLDVKVKKTGFARQFGQDRIDSVYSKFIEV